MAKILIETKPVFFGLGGYEHLYLVFRDDSGIETVIRGGPERDFPPFFGNIEVEVGVAIANSEDAREDNTPADRRSTVVDIGDRNPESVWNIMLQQAQNIDDAGIDYNALNSAQNSNSTIASVLNSVGININTNLPTGTNVGTYPGVSNLLAFSTNLMGTSDPDIIRGGERNDTLNGAEGNDSLDGGLGDDTAVYSDAVENYDFEISDDGETVTITHARGTKSDGTDTLTNVELGQFSDRSVQLLGNTLNFVNDFVVGTTQDTQVIFDLIRKGETSFPVTVFVDGQVTTGNAVFNDFPVTLEAGANPNLIIGASVSEVFGDVAFSLEISIEDNDNPLSGLIVIEDNDASGVLIGDQVDNRGGRTFGDPHLITFDNLAYDFQASGDFILAKATAGAEYEVQARFVALSSAVSVTEAMATSVDGTVISHIPHFRM